MNGFTFAMDTLCIPNKVLHGEIYKALVDKDAGMNIIFKMLVLSPYLSRIEGPPPKRNAARSNRAGDVTGQAGGFFFQRASACFLL